MPLEATVMVIDNSEYMRNGDYQPTRFDAQADAVNVVFQTKTDSNPENTVGLMTSAGKCPEVLVTHSKDLGQILQGVHAARQKIAGSIDIPTAINIAQLALKHRENKNLRQRILVFVGSPLSPSSLSSSSPSSSGPSSSSTGDSTVDPEDSSPTSEKNMIKLAKKLKKNNVAVDIVCFGDGIEGEDAQGKTVLKTFVENVNSGDNSHIVCIPPNSAGGTMLLSDALISSAVLAADRGALIPEGLQEGAGGGGGMGGAGGMGMEGDVDPNMDPELAMALRLSMQEAQAREAAEAGAGAGEGAGEGSGAGAAAAAAAAAVGAGAAAAVAATAAAPDAMDEDEDDEELKKALAMSKGDGDVNMDEDEEEEEEDDEEDGEGEDEEEEDDEDDEDAAIQKAIQMSMDSQKEEGKK